MVYKFRIISNEDEDFFRDIEIKADSSFFDFHQAIQNAVNFDGSYLASFFISNNNWEKLTEVTLMDMSENDEDKKLVMHKTDINELLAKKNEKVIYIFDLFSERAFFIELMDILEPEKDKNYPVLTNGKGKAPIQILMTDFPVVDMDDPDLEFNDEFDEEFNEEIEDY